MMRAAAPLALACGLLGASPVVGLMMSMDAEAGSMTELAELLGRSSLEGLPPEFNTSRLRILADLQEGRQGAAPEEDGGYDCEALPHMCKAPFHCDQWTHQDTMDVRMHGLATPDMHANLRSWCMPGLERYASTVVKECVAGQDLVRSAKSAFRRSYADRADELDASYCFAEGHCTFDLASQNPTLLDMEQICDNRFGGRKGWTKNSLSSLKRLMDMPGAFSSLVSTKDGFHTQRITRVLSKMACAQGIFHCDVQYCKQTYCRSEYYVKKYSHLLPKVKGHLIEDPDLTKEILSHVKHHRH
mmetsp:Transcript_9328/g.28138  ORF Transcript_9328/g.28138 Transcript_9328/m.28138 type:complete len:301 (-) Transcript_9328:95-997(-)